MMKKSPKKSGFTGRFLAGIGNKLETG